MDEEKRIVTIYPNADYDGSIEKLKSTLEKFDASLKSANDDEYQIEIAKDKLEDLCNELDLDIDDLTEEWDSYAPETQSVSNEKMNADIASYVGKIDSKLEDFDVDSFIVSAKQGKADASTRLSFGDKAYELYVDFEDKVYVEFWRIDLSNDAEDPKCKTKLLYSTDFDVNDEKKWSAMQKTLSKFFNKKTKSDAEPSTHKPHHEIESESKDSFPRLGCSVDEALALDAVEKAETLEELDDAIYLISGLQDIDEKTHRMLDRIIAYKRRVLDKPVTNDAEYEYDEKLARDILDEIMNGANADVPKNIKRIIVSHGGEVESMQINPNSIHVLWHIGNFKSDNRIYLDNLDKDAWLLAEDISHAIFKERKLSQHAKHDSADVHVVDLSKASMKDVALACDMLDEAGIKYSISNDKMKVQCGQQTWKQLCARFKIFQGEC